MFWLCVLSAAVVAGEGAFDGPFAGLPEPDLANRRCGTGCGANDTSSAMCEGASDDGRLGIALAEMEARCAADAAVDASGCVGFGQFQGGYFRPITHCKGAMILRATPRTALTALAVRPSLTHHPLPCLLMTLPYYEQCRHQPRPEPPGAVADVAGARLQAVAAADPAAAAAAAIPPHSAAATAVRLVGPV